jgi:hypothetical protein
VQADDQTEYQINDRMSFMRFLDMSISENIYPNPTQNGDLIIDDAELDVGSTIEVYALNGGIVGVYEIAGAQTIINIGHLAAGTYIVQPGSQAAKVVKQ